MLVQLKNGLSAQPSVIALLVSPLQMIGTVSAMEKYKKGERPEFIDLGKGLKFCLNCEDMDDLATDDEQGDKETVKKRFQNCQKTGRFDGDVCSRMYVVNENDYVDQQFTEPDEEN